MKLKTAVKYQLWEARQSVGIFYGIILVLIVIVGVLSRLSNGAMSGMDGITPIFLFVAGIVTFTTEFKVYMQNGLSRKLLSQSILLSFVIGCFIMLIADLIIGVICLITFPDYISASKQLYPTFDIASRYFFHYGLLLFMSYVGYFIGALYYRMNKLLTILVSVCVPILFTYLSFGICIVDTNDQVTKSVSPFYLGKLIDFIGQSPLHLGAFLLSFAAVFALLAHLLTRKAYIK